MIKVTRYFLYGLLFNIVCLVGMQSDPLENARIKEQVEHARNLIDEDHLGMSKCMCLIGPYKDKYIRSLIGTCLSYYQSTGLTTGQIIYEMSQIESYVGQKNSEIILKKLGVRHWYVGYLMEILINKKIEELKAVKGSTIDTLYFPEHKKSFKKIVHESALERFFDEVGIKKSITDVKVPFDVLFYDIHRIDLHRHADVIDPSSLVMSWSDNYLKAVDCKNNEIIWDMEKGIQVDDLNDAKYKTIKWTPGDWIGRNSCGVMNTTETYYAEYHSPKRSQYNPGIALFKKPQEVSYLCQIAFVNSKDNHQELLALRDSQAIQKIEGFPKDQLKQLITDQISQ